MLGQKRIIIVDNYGDFDLRQARINLLKKMLQSNAKAQGLKLDVMVVDGESERFNRMMQYFHDANGYLITGSLEKPARNALKSKWMRSQSQWLKNLVQSENTPPVLAICFGHQLLGVTFGSNLQLRKIPERSKVRILTPTKKHVGDPIVRGEKIHIVCNHDYQLSRIPDGFVQLAHTDHPGARVQLIRHKDKPVYGIQGHPEGGRILGTKRRPIDSGERIFSRFVSVVGRHTPA